MRPYVEHTVERFVANHHRLVHHDVLAHDVHHVAPPLSHEPQWPSGLAERPRLTPRGRGAEALAEAPTIRVVAERVPKDPLDDLVGKLRRKPRRTLSHGILVIARALALFSFPGVGGLGRRGGYRVLRGARHGGLARESRGVAHYDRSPNLPVRHARRRLYRI